jgi:hypothetical protein
VVGPSGSQFFVARISIVGVIEAGDDGAPEESELALADEPRALPYSGGNEDLDLVTGEQIGPENYDGGTAVGMELEHLDGIAEIEVEDLIGVEQVHLRELALFEEVVDGCALCAGAARELECGGGRPGLAKTAALDGVRIELEQGLYLFSGHSGIVNEPLKLGV